jgi:hypothetical protein
VAIEGPITWTKWSHIAINFTEADIKPASFSQIDAMVITAHIDKWDITGVLVDNGYQSEILFLLAFNQMGFDRKQLKEVSKPLYGFGRRRIEPVGSISLPVSFGSLRNAHTKYISLDVVDMNYTPTMLFLKEVSSTPSKQSFIPPIYASRYQLL